MGASFRRQRIEAQQFIGIFEISKKPNTDGAATVRLLTCSCGDVRRR